MVRPKGDQALDEAGRRLRVGLRPEQGLFDAGRLGRRGLGGLRLRLRVHRDFFGRRRHRRLFAFGALRPLIEIEGLQRRDAAREGAISDPRDIRSPQFLEEKATGIARRPSEVAWTRSEAETIEGRNGLRLILADRHPGLAPSVKGARATRLYARDADRSVNRTWRLAANLRPVSAGRGQFFPDRLIGFPADPIDSESDSLDRVLQGRFAVPQDDDRGIGAAIRSPPWQLR